MHHCGSSTCWALLHTWEMFLQCINWTSFTGIWLGYVWLKPTFRLKSSMMLKRRQGNVLINDANEACLIDFGLSYIRAEFEGTPYWSSTVGGALRWRAPELLPPKDDHQPVLTFKCDIYSFGCVMLQVRVVVKSDRHLSLTSTTLDRHSRERFLLVTSSLIYV